MCVYICMYACVYVYMYVYVSMLVRTHVCLSVCQSDVCMHASHTFSHLCTHAGLLLTHIDELLLYADVDKGEGIAGSKYALAEQLLPHLEFYVSRLDMVCLCFCVSP